jgi:hypothetical protein
MAIAGLLPLPALTGGAYRESVAQLALRLILAGNRRRFIGERADIAELKGVRPNLNMIYRGSTRTVVTFGRLAFKFGRGKNGMRCNQHEADLYRRSSARRRSMLCPVLWCSHPAFVSIMRRATTPITKGALDERKGVAWLEWDYAGPSDDGLPFEWKPSDWGYLDGRVVALDYAATAEL